MHGWSSSLILLVTIIYGPLSVFIDPHMHYLLHSRVFCLLLIRFSYGKFNVVAYNCFYRVTLDLSSLLLRWYLLSKNLLCAVNHSLQIYIYISYSKNCWVFHPPCLEGFPIVYLVSYGWLFYVANLFMRFIYGWYMWLIYMSLIYENHMWWNWPINFLKFKHL